MMKYLPWWSEQVPQLLPLSSSFVLHLLQLCHRLPNSQNLKSAVEHIVGLGSLVQYLASH